MPRSLLVAALLLAVAALAGAAAPRSDDDLVAAFKADGFAVASPDSWLRVNGSRGIVGAALNATVLSTGQPKPMYYVEGTAYEQGYLMGVMAEPMVSTMTGVYMGNTLLGFLARGNPDFSKHSALFNRTQAELMHLFEGAVVREFNTLVQQDVFPAELLQEMHGLVAGARAANPKTTVTFERVVTLNYGFDFLLAKLYSKTLPQFLRTEASMVATLSEDVLSFLAGLRSEQLVPSIFCDAFIARGDAMANTEAAVFARDFQMPTGGVFQDIAAMIISVPSDGRLAAVASAAPGFIGAVTAMNELGVTMGVDMMDSGASNSKAPGLNSLLLIKHVISNARSLDDLIRLTRQAKRGASYLYPSADITGRGAVLETTMWVDGSLDELSFVDNDGMKPLLPTAKQLASLSKVDGTHGVYVREMDYDYPTELLQWNEQLFQARRTPYNASAWGERGFIVPHWQNETTIMGSVRNYFFPPQRETMKDVVLCSNMAIIPQARVTQMTDFCGWLAGHFGHCMQWRYDTINALLQQLHGSLDVDKAKWVITFLSPDRTPGYWSNYLNAKQPMSAVVEGAISVVDLKASIMWTKSGYWMDDWTQASIRRYTN
eukprot:PLAT9969.1.p1 GENE.PLAT9969.1~~PLAT9969.1.p1  ORF type:complete len:602 (+),score=319.75 PLAT9969.1:26-1831(+)